jgi:microcin C transport system substrate-binding protein
MINTLRIAVLALGAVLVLAPLAEAQEPVWRIGTSLVGDLKYQQGFAHFDYVNPDAPKGGTVRLSDTGSFDTFNPILPKGEAASGLGLVYETLMTPSMDEVSTNYGLLAEALTYPPDFSSVTYRLRANAKWQDGQPVTPQDVVWSFQKTVALNPSQANYYHNVTKAEVVGDREVKFTFDQAGNRELPNIMGQLLVLPQHWWEGKDANGKQRDIGASTLELPMGSGPYKIKSFSAGTTVTYARDPNYWGAKEPVMIGSNNFDEISYDSFRDPDVAFEGFKADQFDWWEENTARHWAQAYDFPAVKDGRVIKELFPQEYASSGQMVAFVPNLRLDKFKDPRVRRALNYAFDFEQLSRTLFFGQYERIDSYFNGTELASSGLPTGKELEILQSVKDKIPPQVFTTPYTNPVSGDATKLRANLREALKLLNEAGYTLNGNQLVDAKGQQLSFEILLNGPTIAPVATNLQTNLRSIGINVTLRSVDSSQYVNRLRSRDFEVIYAGWGESLSPGNEQRDFWSSGAAKGEDSRNYGGISDPGVDALIDKVIYAPDRETLVAATKALDRVLLANYYVIPTYMLANARIARWDRFSHPATLPKYSIGFPEIWWWDQTKAAKTGGGAQ